MNQSTNQPTADQIAELKSKHFGDEDRNRGQLPLITQEIKDRVNNTKHEIYRIGELLTEAKEFLNHGEFKQWIKKNFDFKYQSANNFMNVYRACLGRPSLVQNVKASVLYQIAAPGFPKDLREYIISSEDQLKEISNKQIRQIMKRYKNGELNVDSPEIQALAKYRESKEEWRHHSAAVNKATDSVRELRNIIVKKCDNIPWPVINKNDKLIVNQQTADTINELYSEIKQGIIKTKPQLQIEKSLKPKFRIDGK